MELCYNMHSTMCTESLDAILTRAGERPKALTHAELAFLLGLTQAADLEALFAAARAVKQASCGRGIAVRGLIEAGNICAKDCYYCGIRKSNASVNRYALTIDEIYAAALEAQRQGFASVVIQSGELESEVHTAFIEDALRKLAPLNLGITLSLGEQSEETYARWRAAGASRYLLRIETSNRELYAKLHPASCDWSRRADCLKALRRTGYQVGTGVMCGLPGQTLDDLARDIQFFGDLDVDMIGMGPYIPHEAAPLVGEIPSAEARFCLGLKMIAVTRLYLHDVNIAAATALQALDPHGRRKGILAGANVLMPNVTAANYRQNYNLYAGKPQTMEDLENFPEPILYRQLGDSRHFNRQRKAAVINDFSSFGRCSLAVTLPILSAMRVQCCSVPTAIFTNHTGFEHFSWVDFTEHMDAYIRDWQATGLRFDAIATGFLGSVRQIDFVKRFVAAFREPWTTVIVDPVMGDNGQLYPTYDPSLPAKMRELLGIADVITPNLTEACVLAGRTYDPAMSDAELDAMCRDLTQSRVSRVVISGISRGDEMMNFVYERGQAPALVFAPRVGPDRSGTGDVFSSVILGDLVHGVPFTEAVRHAAVFVEKAMVRTTALNLPKNYGLAIEDVLGELIVP